LPVVDEVAQDYVGRVDVIAVAWRSSYEATAIGAAAMLPSGVVRWALDADERVFSAFEIPYQPVTVLVAGGVEVDRWLGARGEEGIRAAMDTLASYVG